jgi:hypothetical protein
VLRCARDTFLNSPAMYFRRDDTELEARRASMGGPDPRRSLNHDGRCRMGLFDHIAVKGICGLNAATRGSCTVPCKEQARNREVAPALISYTRRLVARAGHRCCLSCPLPLRERAQWCAHRLEWVRGCRGTTPLTHHRTWQHRAALSRKGRGRNHYGHPRAPARCAATARRPTR